MMSQEMRDIALVLKDRFNEKSRLQDFMKKTAVGYVFSVFEGAMSDLRQELAAFGGDTSQIKYYRASDEDYIVLKIGDGVTTVYGLPKIGYCTQIPKGSSGLCGRFVVFDGDYRNLEVQDPEQLTTIEENSLFLFSDNLLFHVVAPVGLHQTDVPRFVHLTVAALAQKAHVHYSPQLEQIRQQQE